MRRRCLLTTLVLLILATASLSAQITSPESFFGFKPGTDRKLVRWDEAVKYFNRVGEESDRIQVMNMGPSTMGHPFLVLLISSPENLANLDRLKAVNKALSDPRRLSEETAEQYIKEGKAVVVQSYGLHSSEVGGPQCTPNAVYDLLSKNDAETKRILDEVLFFMIPNFNPDGDILINDWYHQTLGTAYEGAGMPWLYHKYIGHDTNRDGDFLNMVESQYAAKIMYTEWPAQAYIDHHQMGSYGARFFVPPYCEPIRPYADPLIWREISWYGSHIAYKLEEEGVKGVINAAMFPGWGHFGWHWITPFHNIAGMLTESASADLATPLYIHPEQLKGGSRAFPEYKAQSTFPSPWEGGWWRLGDIVRQKEIATRALLDHAARNRETVLRNALQKARHQIRRGAEGDVNTIVVPIRQHDPLTVKKMINTLLKSGIEIRQAEQDFIINRRQYAKGSFIITLAQPKMGLIRNLLMETHYADNDWTRGKDGRILNPYDLSTHTMNEFMGVETHAVKIDNLPAGAVLKAALLTKGSVDAEAPHYVLDGRLNDSFRAVNLLQAAGVPIWRQNRPDPDRRQGDFLIKNGTAALISEVAEKTGVTFSGLQQWPEKGIQKLEPVRVGMYRRYYGGNMDEGWTRFLLEQFDFPYKTVRDDIFKKGKIEKQFDVLIFPSDSPGLITGDLPERYKRWINPDLPDKYKSGLGKDGVENLKAFVNSGGTVVMFADAWKFAKETFDLQLTDVTEGLDSDRFFCSGSTLHAKTDGSHPLAWGMPDEALLLFTGSPVFEVTPGRHNDDYQTVVRYPEEGILKSGWLVGEKFMAGKSALVTARYGEGRIILIGFRTQHRAQTHGTFKFLFNALLSSY